MALSGKIAVVTGASRGIGRGIALQLGEAGATVYLTGRSPTLSLRAKDEELPSLQKTADEVTERGGKGIAVYVDHSNQDEVRKFFKKVEDETNGVIDILVNNAYSAVMALCDANGKAFWEVDEDIWDEVNNVGLRNHYYCCVYAARLMVPRKKGLIVNISSAGGLRYLFNVAYGVGKCAVDRMSADMAVELRQHNVAVISLWPGAVQTEIFYKIVKSGKFDDSLDKTAKMLKKEIEGGETPEFAGKAVVALAKDHQIFSKSGRTLIAADLGIEYGFKDINDRQPPSIRSIRWLLSFGGYTTAASWFPDWIRIPGWLMTAFCSRL